MTQEEKDRKDSYDLMAVEEPIREVEVVDSGKTSSLSEVEDSSPLISDFQSAQRRLFPDFGDEVYNRAEVSRIGEDVFMDLLFLFTIRDIYRKTEDEDIDVIGSLANSYNVLSIGVAGKGREDDIVMAGSARETEELKKIGQNLGY